MFDTLLIHLTFTSFHRQILTGTSTLIKVTGCGEKPDHRVSIVDKIQDVEELIPIVTGHSIGEVRTQNFHSRSSILFLLRIWPSTWPFLTINWPLSWPPTDHQLTTFLNTPETGASSNPCSETYAGPKAFSEPETQAMARYLWERRARTKVYVSFHAYSQMWLTPWGYTSNLPANFNDLMAKARAGADAVASVYGTKYTVGSSTRVLC